MRRPKPSPTARFCAVLSRSTHNRKPNRKQRATENVHLIPSRPKQAEVQPYAMLIGTKHAGQRRLGKSLEPSRHRSRNPGHLALCRCRATAIEPFTSHPKGNCLRRAKRLVVACFPRLPKCFIVCVGIQEPCQLISVVYHPISALQIAKNVERMKRQMV